MLVGRPSPEFRAIVYGPPKNGKSTFVLEFAKYLCGFGSVMYVSAEELIAKTFRDRMMRLGITEQDNICILAERKYSDIKRAITNWRPRFLVVDSAHRCHLTHSQLNTLHEQHKAMASVVILQGTKDGNFKGDTAWEHDADIIIRLANGVAHQRGRFCADSKLQIFGRHADLFTPQQPD
jgi:predicted ATP-dependent serine protease